MRVEFKTDILDIIGRFKNGLHLSKIAEHSGLSVQTVSKYCHVLQAERKVEIERLGDMKIVKKIKQ